VRPDGRGGDAVPPGTLAAMPDPDAPNRRSHPALRVGLAIVAVGASGLLLSLPFTPLLLLVDRVLGTTRAEVLDHPPLPDALPPAAETSVIRASDGSRLAEVSGPVRREIVPFDAIPAVVVQAVVATEDARFFEHEGVDHRSMVRAAGRNVVAGSIEEGASTITQQLVRLTLLDRVQTFERKVQEVVWAVELEERLTKEEILERYLNAVYLGEGVYGVATAARHYFSRPLDDLTLGEAALLAGTIRAPALTNPVADPEAAMLRRDVVIEQLRGLGWVTDEEADRAREEPLRLDVQRPERVQPFWDDLVSRLLHDPGLDLQAGVQDAVGRTPDERFRRLHEGGLTIETTLDPALQDHAEATLAAHLDDPAAHPLASLLAVEHATGAVRALAVGPRDFGVCADDDEPCARTQVNPAVPGAGSAGRQPGSAFKPFVVAAALEQGIDLDLTYDAPSGEPIEGCGIGEEYAPRNFRDEDQEELTLAEALARSSNVYFAKLARDVGIPAVVESALRHGVTHSPTLRDFEEGMCSLGLGAARVYPLDLAVGYGVWANHGERCEPHLIERILDRHGDVLYEHRPTCVEVVDPEVARQVRALLRTPVGPDGTAPFVGEVLGEGAVGKTGTTNAHVDAWFVGSAGPLTTAVWVGFERAGPMEDLVIGGEEVEAVTGSAVPAPVFADFHAGLP
jgi:penicillin-binding protein 1A